MRFLIEQCQGDVNYKNDKGRTQLHSAARWGYPETVKLFLKYARDVNARDNDAMTPLMCCAEAGREFISYDDENGRHIFGPYGKPDGHIETIRVLIGAGADVNARNNKGATAAAIAAEKKFSDIVAALSAGGTGAPLRSENRKSDGLFRRLSRKIFGSSKSDASLKPWPRAANEVHYDPTGQSQNTPPAFEFQIEEGGAITNMAVQHRMFAAGEGKAFLVTFLSPAPTLRLAGDSDNYIEVRGQLTCNPPCFLPVPFEIEFSGPSGGGELHCNACGSGYGLGFGYRRADDQWNGKIDPTGFFFWFTPHTRGPDNEFVMHGLRVQRLEVKLLSEK